MQTGTLWQNIGKTCLFGIGFLLIQAHLVYANSAVASTDAETEAKVLPEWLELEGQIELEVARIQNGNLDRPKDDVRTLLRPELQLEIRVMPSDQIEGLLLLELSPEFELEDDLNEEKPEDWAFGIKEAHLTVKELLGTPLSVQMGRLDFEDDRQWLYDDELDGIRLRFESQALYVEAFYARGAIVEKDFIHGTGKDDTDYYQLFLQYRFSPRLTLATYLLAQDDNQPMGERPWFLGLRLTGKSFDHLHYWIDAAHVRGKDEDRRLRGWGLDLGLQYWFELPLTPSVIASFALGSGDQTPESSTDTSFRQTGIQGNGAEFESVSDIQYYGEFLDPELSNLFIYTLGLGVRPLPNASLTVLYHIYRQHFRSDELRDAAIDVELTGESREIGREVDVMAVWALDEIELQLIFGAFFPGNAFSADAETAFFTQVRLQVTF